MIHTSTGERSPVPRLGSLEAVNPILDKMETWPKAQGPRPKAQGPRPKIGVRRSWESPMIPTQKDHPKTGFRCKPFIGTPVNDVPRHDSGAPAGFESAGRKTSKHRLRPAPTCDPVEAQRVWPIRRFMQIAHPAQVTMVCMGSGWVDRSNHAGQQPITAGKAESAMIRNQFADITEVVSR